MYKKILLILILISYSSNSVRAQEASEPYRLDQGIQNELPSKEACLIQLQGTDSETDDRKLEQINQLEAEINELGQDFNLLNEEIAALENNSENSISLAEYELNQAIELAYQNLVNNDPEFINLSPEDQEMAVNQDPSVQEWSNYYQDLLVQMDQLVLERDDLESQYNVKLYELQEVKSNDSYQDDNQAENSQCSLFPYTTEALDSSQILINPNIDSLSKYILQLDTIMNHLVPKAYAKLKFQQIHHVFNKFLHQDDLNLILSNKTKVVLDDQALNIYSYAQELNLADIETLAQYAQVDYLSTKNFNNYMEEYRKVINLKEAQFQYFYQINSESFQIIQESFLQYLNQNLLTDETSVREVQKFQNKFQVKLVFFDEINKLWTANPFNHSGNYDEFYNKDIVAEIEESSETSKEATDLTKENQSNEGSNQFSQDLDKVSPKGDQTSLDQIKANLGSRRAREKTKTNKAPVSSRNQTKSNKKSPKDTNHNESKNLNLPDTGERNIVTRIALILSILGLSLFMLQLRSRRKEKKKQESIDLD